MFDWLKNKQLEAEQQKLDKASNEVYRKRNELDKQIEKSKEKLKELAAKERELDRSITADKIKTVLKIFAYNKIKPYRIIVNDEELKLIKGFRDTVRVPQGIQIYGVRIVNEHTKRPFVVSTKRGKK